MTSIDLHTHVVPPTIIAEIQRDPARFGARGTSFNGRSQER